MNNEKKNLDCEIVRDLLPLYYDGVVSETTKNAVKEHLGDCEGCLKEYRDFCTQTPETKEENTGKRFGRMMNKQKIRQRIKMAIAAVVACLVLAGSYYGLTELRLVCINDMEVHKVFQYQSEEGKEKFFMLFSTEVSGYSSDLDSWEENGKIVYELKLKRPIIRKSREEKHTSKVSFVTENCDVLICEGKTVWTKELNGDDEVPDYVYAYEYFEENNQEKLAENFIGEQDAEKGIAMIGGDDYIGIVAGDRVIKWNLDGEVIFDSSRSGAENR